MKNRILFILFFVFSHFQGFSQNESRKYRILTYGLQHEIENAELVVNQKWNIEKFTVAGCIVSQKLIDSVKVHNKSIWKLIENENGFENSELNYLKDISNTRKDLEKIKSLVYKHNLTNKIWRNLKNKKNDYLIFTNPKFNTESIYSISIKKRNRKIDNHPKNRVYNLTVDLSTETLTIDN
ncbi:hypothetical protein [Pontimicrobium aquaticum]|uniref:Uncharacterized protein n=1 Tax=Pontimicrobium aquaticum TaxID=2565367 RepID=A0A4U0EMX2_9FLAO|nr:hypothetical protein [Pontimicrobium aquaticum]TJY32936.1 hypothetical protein E5167_13975 [Pontimicrobium aquaticum]